LRYGDTVILMTTKGELKNSMQYGDTICGDPIRIAFYLDLIRSLQVVGT